MSAALELSADDQSINLHDLVKVLRNNGYEVVSRGFNKLAIKPSGFSSPKKEK